MSTHTHTHTHTHTRVRSYVFDGIQSCFPQEKATSRRRKATAEPLLAGDGNVLLRAIQEQSTLRGEEIDPLRAAAEMDVQEVCV